MRSIRMIGLLIAALMTVGTASASAHEFIFSKTGNLKGSADTSQELEFSAGSGEFVLCDKLSVTGTVTTLKTEKQAAVVQYEECKAKTFLGELPAEIGPAHYTFLASGGVEITEPIKINIGPGLAEQTVTDQTVSSVTYSNSSPVATIMINANVTGIHSEGSLGTQTTGTYTGESLMSLEGGTVGWDSGGGAPPFEGPSWWLKKARLGANQNVSASTPAGLSINGSKVKVECVTISYPTGQLIASAAGEVGTEKVTLELTKCKVPGEAVCTVRSLLEEGKKLSPAGTIGPYKVGWELAYPRGVKLHAVNILEGEETLKEGVEVRKYLFDLYFEGTCANVGKLKSPYEVTGTATAAVVNAAKAEMTAGQEEAKVGLEFPAKAIEEVERWNGKEYKPAITQLRMTEQTSVSLDGSIVQELASKEAFGWTNK